MEGLSLITNIVLQKKPKKSDCSSRVFLPTPQNIGSTETYYRHKLYTTLKINMYFSLLHSPSDISRKKKKDVLLQCLFLCIQYMYNHKL